MDLYSIRKDLSLGIPLTQMKLRATDYSRVSTNHLEQQSSLKNQIEHFEKFIKDNPNWNYVPGYVDDGISGTTDYKRDNFMKMIDDAKEGKFDLIVTKEISRFSRNTLDSIKYTRELLNYGVAVLFVNDNINTALPDSELRLTIMASMAQDEIRRLSERVKFGMNQSIANGTILGNNLLYGYKKDKNTGNLVMVESEANLIREMYNWYAIDECSLCKIAKIINERGIKTCQGKKWCTSTISRMIKNPKYKGFYVGKKSEVIDYMLKTVKKFDESEWVMYKDYERIPPIVDADLWERANKRLKLRNKQFGTGYSENQIMYKGRYTFSSKIYCGEHNVVFHRRMNRRNREEISWFCSEYEKKGKKVCDTPIIRECELYSIFDYIANELKINLDKVNDILLELYQTNKKSISIDLEKSKLLREKENIYLKKEKLLELNMEGNISNAEYGQKNENYNEKIKQIKEKIILLERQNENYNKIDEKNKKLKKILSRKIKTKEVKDKLISLILEKIVVSKIENNKENVELSIFFNFSEKFVNDTEKIICANNLKCFFRKDFEFKRGFNKTGTRRYIMNYKVLCYICI